MKRKAETASSSLILGVKCSHQSRRQHECRQSWITLMIVNAVCALQHTKKTFRTKLARNGLPVPVADGYTRTVLKTVC